MTMPSDTLLTYLLMGLFLLVFGIYSMVRHRTFIGMLISGEFILNGASLNFMAFNRFLAPDPAVGQVITLIIMGLAAAEAALIVSLILMVFNRYRSIDPDEVRDLKG
jgi:NADH:ubiquinone oxidoreductase subunit K